MEKGLGPRSDRPRALVAWPFGVHGQQVGKIIRIGFIGASLNSSGMAAQYQALHELGSMQPCRCYRTAAKGRRLSCVTCSNNFSTTLRRALDSFVASVVGSSYIAR
jgi:hypothetical protein